MFCTDELQAKDFFEDESADHTNLPVTALLRGNIIVTSHVCSVVDDSKLLLDIQKLYGTYFYYDAVLLARQISIATPECLPCNQLYLLQKAPELQSMLWCLARLMLNTQYIKFTFKVEISFPSFDNAALAVMQWIQQLASIGQWSQLQALSSTTSTKLDTLGLDFNDAVRRSMRRPNCLMLVRCLVDSKSTHKLSCMHASAFLKGLVPCWPFLT